MVGSRSGIAIMHQGGCGDRFWRYSVSAEDSRARCWLLDEPWVTGRTDRCRSRPRHLRVRSRARLNSNGGSAWRPCATHQEIYGVLFSSAFAAVFLCVDLVLNGLGGALQQQNRRHLLFRAMSATPCLALGLFGLLNPLPNYLPLWSVVTGWFLCIPFHLACSVPMLHEVRPNPAFETDAVHRVAPHGAAQRDR